MRMSWTMTAHKLISLQTKLAALLPKRRQTHGCHTDPSFYRSVSTKLTINGASRMRSTLLSVFLDDTPCSRRKCFYHSGYTHMPCWYTLVLHVRFSHNITLLPSRDPEYHARVCALHVVRISKTSSAVQTVGSSEFSSQRLAYRIQCGVSCSLLYHALRSLSPYLLSSFRYSIYIS